MNWFIDVTGSVYGGGIFCTLLMVGLNFFVIVGMNNAVSRLAWSMARDKGLPFSDYFAHISPRFHIPVRTLVAAIVIDLILGMSSGRIASLRKYIIANLVVEALSFSAQILPSNPSFLEQA